MKSSLTFIFTFFVCLSKWNNRNGGVKTQTTENSSTVTVVTEDTSVYYGTNAWDNASYISLEDIDVLLLNETVQGFLSGFKSEFEREVILQQLRHCPRIDLCGFSLGLDPPNERKVTCCQPCSCHFPSCMQNKTCCPDIIFNNTNALNNNSVSFGVPVMSNQAKIQRDCISLYLTKQSGSRGIFGYATCPDKTNDELMKNCTRSYDTGDSTSVSLLEVVPVRSKVSLDIYRNKYCAYCNDMFDHQFDTLKVHVSCTDPMLLETEEVIIRETLVDNKCNVQFYGPDNCVSAVDKCNVTGLWNEYDANIDTACSIYRSVISIDDDNLPSNMRTFQNVFCSLCNGIPPFEAECDLTFDSPESNFPFSRLLNMNAADESEGIFGVNDCFENQLYDYVLKTCKDMFCSEIMSLHQGQCWYISEQLEETTYTVYLRIRPTQTLSILDSNILSEAVTDYLRNVFNGSNLCGMQTMYNTDQILNKSDLRNIEQSNLLYFDTRLQYHFSQVHIAKDIVIKLMGFHDLVHTFPVRYNKTVRLQFEVRDGNPSQFNFIAFISQLQQYNNRTYNSSVYSVPMSEMILSYTAADSNNLAIFPHIRGNDDIGYCSNNSQEYPILWLTPCSKVNISKLDLPWNETDDSLTIQIGDYTINSNEYYHVDETHIMVCSDKYEEFMLHVMPHTVDPLSFEAMLSIACSSLSILSLLLTLVTFCTVSKLRRTIPGKNNISLVISLLCAQCLYMVSSFGSLETNSKECWILGILLHFTLLVAMFWMNICTFYMFTVLAHTQVISHGSGMKQVLIYHVFALFMAAIFVSINISVSYYNSGDIGYGDGICYISSQEMVIYTFGIPTAFVVVCNLCLFTCVIIKIKRSPSVQKNVQHERNDLIVFAKLSTITGVSWIFGFLYTWTNVTAMSYLFIILNAGQGVFIMLAFVINRRVYNMFRTMVLELTITSSEGGAYAYNS